MLTPEELIKPRYKVIADYPGLVWPIWYIAELGKNEISHCDKFPHLFKPLEWWEERAEKDMPEYVKLVINGKVQFVHKVIGWVGNNSDGQPLYKYINKVSYECTACVIGLEPATETEYLNFVKPPTP